MISIESTQTYLFITTKPEVNPNASLQKACLADVYGKPGNIDFFIAMYNKQQQQQNEQ